MGNARIFENLPWTRVHGGRAAGSAVPSLPGVYAYAAVCEHLGLPTSLEWVYIGMTRRLDRRLGQHDPVRSANPELGHWLATRGESSQLWYAVVDLADLGAVEQDLIRTIRPRFNRRLYGGIR